MYVPQTTDTLQNFRSDSWDHSSYLDKRHEALKLPRGWLSIDRQLNPKSSHLCWNRGWGETPIDPVAQHQNFRILIKSAVDMQAVEKD